MSAFTASQQRAITAPGNVLVVAGAGAGKTTTLVERCAHCALLAQPRVRLDEMLVVTFTEAAATEVKARLRQRLLDALREADRAEERGWLEEQLALLDVAAIGTLHAFCLRLVREHFHELGLDPQLSVLPEEQVQLLRRETMEAIFEAHYAEAHRAPRSRAVWELVSGFGRAEDRPIRELVWRLHDYTQTLPNPAGWYARQLAAYAQPEPVQWRHWLDRALAAWRNRWLPALDQQPSQNRRAHELAARLGELPEDAERRQFAKVLAAVVAADASWPRGSKGRFREPIAGFYDDAAFLHSLTVGGAGPDPLAEDWQWTRGPMQTLLELAREFAEAFATAKRELAGVDFHDLEQFALRLLWNHERDEPTPLAQALRQRFRRVFVDEYQDINRAQDQIIRALSGEGDAANRFLVGDVKQCIYRFRLSDPRVFEAYRDAWRVQSAQAGVGGNDGPAANAAGGAPPSAPGIPPSPGEVVVLAENFRSHEMLLRFLNRLFTDLMSRELGGVDYRTEDALQFGAPGQRTELTAAHDASPRVEVHLYLPNQGRQPGSTDEDDAAESTRAEQEARLVARQLRRLHDAGTRVWDKEEQRFRPMRWTDAAVLLRAMQGKAELYAREFQRAGVPLQVAAGDFYDSAEVLDLLNLLQLLDNPLQDLPLLAVLRSPLVGLSLDELAAIRLVAPEAPWWTALRRWAEVHGVAEAEPAGNDHEFAGVRPSSAAAQGARDVAGCSAPTAPASPDRAPGRANSTARKVRTFLDRFTRWRRLAREAPLSQGLEAVLNETLYCEWLAARPRGAQRVANVQRLLTLAEQFDPFQRQGIARFLRFVEAQQEAESGGEPAALDGQEAVQLTTIHKSKGLEYPIVVLADLGKRFNLQDLAGPVILDEDYGLCPQIRPPRAGAYPSLPYWLAKQRQRREVLGEELRLLYVAMTRARDRLLLVGTCTATTASKWNNSPATPTPAELESASTCLQWLGPWWTRQIGRADWWQESAGTTELFEWRIHRTPPPDSVQTSQAHAQGQRRDAVGQTAPAPTPDPAPSRQAALRAAEARLHWRYPSERATVEAAKRSVTALARQAWKQDEDAAPAWRAGNAADANSQRRIRHAALGASDSGLRTATGGNPSPASKPLSAAERGSAHHTFLQRVALSQTGDEASLREEARRLVMAGVLTAEEAAALDVAAIREFWTSELGRRLRTHAAHVHRELPFTARFTADDLAGLGVLQTADALTDEFFVVQGVADLAVILPDALWLVDFKTDQLTAAELPEKLAAYRPQLQLYALALSRIYRRPVRETWLHFLSLQRSVPIHG
jgi:ATP-dependent helicase/nuclease subunit A